MTYEKKSYSTPPSGLRPWKCRSLQRENCRFYWLTNKFGCQTRLQAQRQVCFQVEGSVGIWLSLCFNSNAVVAGCLRTICNTNIKGQSIMTLLLILFMFYDTLKCSPLKKNATKPFFPSSTLCNCNPLSKVALTAGIVEHHDVVYSNVALSLPGNGCLNQNLWKWREREYITRINSRAQQQNYTLVTNLMLSKLKCKSNFSKNIEVCVNYIALFPFWWQAH